MDSVEGMIMAPPAPSAILAAMSCSGVRASAATTAATANATSPAPSSRRRRCGPQPGHRDEQRGEDEPVGVDDPQQLGALGARSAASVGQRDVEDRRVDGDEQQARGQDGEHEPAVAGALRGVGHGVALRGDGSVYA
jgi:hypothetical protein